MRRATFLFFAAFVCLLPAFSCSSGGDFAGVVKSADGAAAFEGLPHPAFEKELYEQERAKPVRELLGYPLYEGAAPLKAEDVAALRAILGEQGTYASFSGEKKCGGFHPDWALEWSRGSERFTVLICFGCDEVKLLGPGGESRHDLAGDSSDRIEKILRPYRKNRPEPK